MNKTIKNQKLTDFLKNNKENNFAQITFNCGATSLVHRFNNWNHKTDELLHSYTFNELILDDEDIGDWKYSYYVLFVPNKTYLMYEIEDNKIKIWVCYTEKQERGKGHMTNLLNELILIYPDKKIIIHTFDTVLINICKKLKQIELFRQ